MSDGRQGGCRCGQVRLKVSGGPMMTMACHCTGCQRMTGGAYSLTSMYPSEAFAVTAGDPVLGGLRGATRHYFCPSCLSWLFTRPGGTDAFVNVRSPMLDDTSGHQPFIETFTSEGFDWAATGAAHSFEAFPPPESYPALLAEFAAARTAPSG